MEGRRVWGCDNAQGIKGGLRIPLQQLRAFLLSCFSRVRLCDSMDCSLPGSSAHGILQARTLEWVAASFSKESSHPGTEPASPSLVCEFFTTSAACGQPKNNRSFLKSLAFSLEAAAPLPRDSQICLLCLLSSQSFLSNQQGMLLELQILCEGKYPQPLEEIKRSNKAKNAT